MANDPSARPDRRSSPVSPQVIAGAVVAVLAVLFVIQNRKQVSVRLLFISVHLRVWAVIVISMVLGGLLTWLAPRALRRGRDRAA